MKRLMIFFGVVFATVSCGRTEVDRPAPELVEWTFTAPASKASLAANGAFSWSRDDAIAVWNSTSGSFVKFTSLTGNSIFTATAPDNAHFQGTAYFPYESVSGTETFTFPASYNAGDYNPYSGIIAMYSSVEEDSNVLHFKHQCAYLTCQIPDIPASVTKIVVSGIDVSLSGDFTPIDNAGVKEIRSASGDGTVTVNYALENKQYMLTFTIPVPIGRYAISYTAYEGEDVFSSKSTDPINFTRAHLYKLYDPSIYNRFGMVGYEEFELTDDTENWN